MSARIEVEHLSKSIRSTEVLIDVSLSVPAGEVVGLAGPNGSGKTMLMRAILGLVRPTKGTARVVGDTDNRPVIGMLLEGPAFLGGYSGLKNLELLASVRQVITQDQAARSMAQMGLDPTDRRPYRAYSLGMKQRMGIAAAMEQPDVLLLDEPTNALDPSGAELAAAQIEAQAARGAAVLLASHDARFLSRAYDKIVTMAEGRIQSIAPAERGNR